jgi:hypothetical protein
MFEILYLNHGNTWTNCHSRRIFTQSHINFVLSIWCWFWSRLEKSRWSTRDQPLARSIHCARIFKASAFPLSREHYPTRRFVLKTKQTIGSNLRKNALIIHLISVGTKPHTSYRNPGDMFTWRRPTAADALLYSLFCISHCIWFCIAQIYKLRKFTAAALGRRRNAPNTLPTTRKRAFTIPLHHPATLSLMSHVKQKTV